MSDISLPRQPRQSRSTRARKQGTLPANFTYEVGKLAILFSQAVVEGHQSIARSLDPSNEPIDNPTVDLFRCAFAEGYPFETADIPGMISLLADMKQALQIEWEIAQQREQEARQERIRIQAGQEVERAIQDASYRLRHKSN